MVYAYIDETGDRGVFGAKPNVSPIFGMAAVLVDEMSSVALREAVVQLRRDFSIPANRVMSWKDHLKTHARRKHAATVLANVKDLKLIYVYSDKRLTTGGFLNVREIYYNYVALKMYKNILWAARSWKGNEGVHTRFGHVKGHDHETTRRYFADSRRFAPTVPFQLERGLSWVSSDRYAESQAADLFAGFLKAGIWPDEFGAIEGMYIEIVWPQIRTNGSGCVVPLGLMSMPESGLVKAWGWYHCKHCKVD